MGVKSPGGYPGVSRMRRLMPVIPAKAGIQGKTAPDTVSCIMQGRVSNPPLRYATSVSPHLISGSGMPPNAYQSRMTGSTSLPNRPMLDMVASWSILDSWPYMMRCSMPRRLWMYSSFSSTWSGVPQTMW